MGTDEPRHGQSAAEEPAPPESDRAGQADALRAASSEWADLVRRLREETLEQLERADSAREVDHILALVRPSFGQSPFWAELLRAADTARQRLRPPSPDEIKPGPEEEEADGAT